MRLTGAVRVVHKVHLEGVSVVQDALGVGRVVLELQTLQRRVILGLLGHYVDGGLPGAVSQRVFLPPGVGSYRWSRGDSFRLLHVDQAA